MILIEKHRQILYWLSVGKTAIEVAEILGSTRNSVAGTLRRMFDEHGVANVVGLVCKAMASGALRRRLDPCRGSELAPLGRGSRFSYQTPHRLV